MRDGEGTGRDRGGVGPDRARTATLRAGALDLVPMGAGDARFYCGLYMDGEVMRHIGPPLDADAASRAFVRALAHSSGSAPRARYWIARDATGLECGLAALVHDRGHPESAELGMMLVPAARRRRHGVDVILAVARHAVEVEGVARLWTRHHADNLPAAGLMRALCFRPGPGRPGDARLYWLAERGVDAACGGVGNHFAIGGTGG